MNQSTKWNVQRLQKCKGQQKLAILTASDFLTARLLDRAGLPAILVGDSLGMTTLGYESTLPVTMEDMLHHTAAVVRGVRHALVIADMPFLSYQGNVEDAVLNAGRFLKEAGADAVKVEGGRIRCSLVEALTANGIPVMGHIGLTPQSVKTMGGYRIQGKTAAAAELLLEDARALTSAGIFSLVLEGMPSAAAGRITNAVEVPTIGIGAGPQCDGQVLVVQDMLGIQTDMVPKFVKQYAQLENMMHLAFDAYKEDVESGAFPGSEYGYD